MFRFTCVCYSLHAKIKNEFVTTLLHEKWSKFRNTQTVLRWYCTFASVSITNVTDSIDVFWGYKGE